jgi:hypothetical protein
MAGWLFIGAGAALAALLVLSARAARQLPAVTAALAAVTAGDAPPEELSPELSPPPADLACRQVVRLVSDYLDGPLPPGWRDGVAEHLSACDGCTAYLEQIRETVRLLERVEAGRQVNPRSG